MAVTIKTEREIELMRESGRMLELVHRAMKEMIKPGISTKEIDECGESMIRRLGGVPNFKNYDGFPSAICISVNDEVVHGIPDSKRILREGDIVSLDAGLIYKGYHSDAARTWGVGKVSPEAQRLMDVTRQCFYEGIRYARAGMHLYQISRAIGEYAERNGCSFRDLLCLSVEMYLAEQARKRKIEVSAWTKKFNALLDSTESRNDEPYKFNRADAYEPEVAFA